MIAEPERHPFSESPPYPLGCWLGCLGPSFADHHVSSNTVKKTQTELKQKGYYDGEVDGVLGAQTRASLRRYQKEKGLAGDGRLTHETAVPPGRRRQGRSEPGGALRRRGC